MRFAFDEAVFSILHMDIRTFTVLAVCCGGALATTTVTGVSASAAEAVVADLAATDDAVVEFKLRPPTELPDVATEYRLPWNVRHVEANSSVVAAVAVGWPDNRTIELTAAAPAVAKAPNSGREGLIAYAGEDPLMAMEAEVVSGRSYDAGHIQRRDRVGIVGYLLAQRLGPAALQAGRTIVAGGVEFTISAIAKFPERYSEFDNTLIVPYSIAPELDPHSDPSPVVVIARVSAGAQEALAGHIPVLLNPAQPEAVLAERSTRGLESSISAADSLARQRSLVLYAVAIGTGIALFGAIRSATRARTLEIGLRRALGGDRGSVILQQTAELVIMGLIGGLLGASLGVLTVHLAAVAARWPPTIPTWVPLATPTLTAVASTVAGLPSVASSVLADPADALRAEA